MAEESHGQIWTLKVPYGCALENSRLTSTLRFGGRGFWVWPELVAVGQREEEVFVRALKTEVTSWASDGLSGQGRAAGGGADQEASTPASD